jgi:hypothetical protein
LPSWQDFLLGMKGATHFFIDKSLLSFGVLREEDALLLSCWWAVFIWRCLFYFWMETSE